MQPEPIEEYRLEPSAQAIYSFVNDFEKYDLEAPYQRGSVWTTEQRQALIRSLLLGLPIGAIVISYLPYLEGREAHYRVIDGKQRIETLRAFKNGDLEVPGHWFHDIELLDADARRRDITSADLSDVGRRGFEQKPVSVIAFKGDLLASRDTATGKVAWKTQSEDEILASEADIYGLINFVGTPQTDVDRRRAANIASYKHD